MNPETILRFIFCRHRNHTVSRMVFWQCTNCGAVTKPNYEGGWYLPPPFIKELLKQVADRLGPEPRPKSPRGYA